MRASARRRRAGEKADVAVLRWELLRAVRTADGDHLRCEVVCRRAGRCAGPKMRCLANLPADTLSPEEKAEDEARAIAMLRQAVNKAIEHHAMARAAGGEPQREPARRARLLR